MLDIKKYFPDVLKDVREFNVLDEAETPELKSLYECVKEVLDNGFIETAKENGVARAEKIVGISPRATDTLEERKFNVLAKYNEDLPYTVTKLNELLSILCGEKGYHLEINNGEFKLTVKVELTSKKSKEAVDELLERVTPANMILSVTLMYNQHKTVKMLTNAELRKYTHNGIREEALING